GPEGPELQRRRPQGPELQWRLYWGRPQGWRWRWWAQGWRWGRRRWAQRRAPSTLTAHDGPCRSRCYRLMFQPWPFWNPSGVWAGVPKHSENQWGLFCPNLGIHAV